MLMLLYAHTYSMHTILQIVFHTYVCTYSSHYHETPFTYACTCSYSQIAENESLSKCVCMYTRTYIHTCVALFVAKGWQFNATYIQKCKFFHSKWIHQSRIYVLNVVLKQNSAIILSL